MGLSCLTYKLGTIIGLYEDLQHLLATAESRQSCLTLCNPMDCGPLDSSLQGILEARVLEWVAIFFSRTWKNRLVQNWERSTSGCILSPCLFNLHAEYIMQNVRLDEAQA